MAGILQVNMTKREKVNKHEGFTEGFRKWSDNMYGQQYLISIMREIEDMRNWRCSRIVLGPIN